MREALTALQTIITNEISYLGESRVYIKADPWDLMDQQKMPFVNLVNIGTKIQLVENVSFLDAERNIIAIQIQYAVSTLNGIEEIYNGTTSRPGIDQLTDDLWTAIKSDTTLDGMVNGLVPGEEGIEWQAEPGVLKVKTGYQAGYTMQVQYYKDVFK